MCFTHSDQFRFFKSLTSIPVVNTALQISSSVYFNLKKCNPYLETTLNTTEQMASYIAHRSMVMSVVQKIEMPVLFVDNLASDGLLILENKYPVIKMSTDDIKDEAMKQMAVIQAVGAKKLGTVMASIYRHRRQGVDMMLIFLETMVSPKISVYVDTIDSTVDNYLPAIEGQDTEGQAVVPHNEKVFARLAYIPHKVQQRIKQRYNQFVIRVTWAEE